MNTYIIKGNSGPDSRSHRLCIATMYEKWAQKQGIDVEVKEDDICVYLTIDFNLDFETGWHRLIDSSIESDHRVTTFSKFYNQRSGEPNLTYEICVRSYIFAPYKKIKWGDKEIIGEKVSDIMNGEIPWILNNYKK
jgi:hypothetical protein